MWHASVSRVGRTTDGIEALEALARELLREVGDASRGEWVEVSSRSVHVRRRLSALEEARVGPAVDIRGTREVLTRLKPVRHLLPLGWKE